MLPYFHKFTADEAFSKTHSRSNHFLSAPLQKNRLNLQIEIPGFDGLTAGLHLYKHNAPTAGLFCLATRIV